MSIAEAARDATPGEAASPASATWITIVGGNDYWWRAQAPASAVGGKVVVIPEAAADEALLAPNTNTAFPWRIRALVKDGPVHFETHVLDSRDGWERFNKVPRELVRPLAAEFPVLEGVAVFVRPDPARAVLGQAMMRQGVRTIAETDDNYFTDPRHNLFARQQKWTAKTHLDHAKAMASMDANVFSTKWLRDRYLGQYRKFFPGLQLPELHVCRNHIAARNWPVIPEYDGPVRVGFMGSTSHVWDLHRGYAAFHAAKHLGATTTVIGYNPGDPDPGIPDEIEAEGKVWQLRSQKSIAVSRKWSEVIDTHIPWVSPESYHRAHLPLDIGIAPLRTNDFTLGKSSIKAIEYSISGAACVLEKHPVYTDDGWVHGVNCLLAKSQEDMGLQTIRLIRDPVLRRELVANAQEMIRNERNEDIMRAEWSAALGL